MSEKKKVKEKFGKYAGIASVGAVIDPFMHRRHPVFPDKVLGYVCLNRVTGAEISRALSRGKCEQLARAALLVAGATEAGRVLAGKDVIFAEYQPNDETRWRHGVVTWVAYSETYRGLGLTVDVRALDGLEPSTLSGKWPVYSGTADDAKFLNGLATEERNYKRGLDAARMAQRAFLEKKRLGETHE